MVLGQCEGLVAQPFQHVQSPKPDGPEYEPACRLVSLFSASGDANEVLDMALSLGRHAASLGETVLVLDAVDGELMRKAGIIHGRSLSDVARGTCELRDALYVTSNEHFTAASVGPQGLDAALGLLAALSLSYDWVFAVPEAGCTPAHVRLATASDVSVMSYDSHGDGFMRAFWMIEAVRRPAPRFDPLILSTGPREDAVETAMMLNDTVRDHLGAPPPYAGHAQDLHAAKRLLEQMREATDSAAVA